MSLSPILRIFPSTSEENNSGDNSINTDGDVVINNAGKDKFEWRIVDKTRYVGKSDATITVEILGFKNNISDNLINAIEIFNKGFNLYQNMKWDEAIKVFEESLKYEEEFNGRPINPSKNLIERCLEYKDSPPAKSKDKWDGVYTMTKK